MIFEQVGYPHSRLPQNFFWNFSSVGRQENEMVMMIKTCSYQNDFLQLSKLIMFLALLKNSHYHVSEASLKNFSSQIASIVPTFLVLTFMDETKSVINMEIFVIVFWDESKLQAVSRVLGPTGFWFKQEISTFRQEVLPQVTSFQLERSRDR